MSQPSSGASISEALVISAEQQEAIILVCSLVAILFGVYNVCRVLAVKVHSYGRGDIEL